MHARFLAWCLDRDCGWASRSLPTEAAARDSLSTGIWAVNAMSRTYPYGVGDSEGPTRIGPLLRAWCNALGLEVANA